MWPLLCRMWPLWELGGGGRPRVPIFRNPRIISDICANQTQNQSTFDHLFEQFTPGVALRSCNTHVLLPMPTDNLNYGLCHSKLRKKSGRSQKLLKPFKSASILQTPCLAHYLYSWWGFKHSLPVSNFKEVASLICHIIAEWSSPNFGFCCRSIFP